MVKSFPKFVLRGCAEHKTSEGFSSLILAAKPAKKAIWAPPTEPKNEANWEPSPSHHPSSGEQDRSRPLPLLRPLCSSVPCINRYQRACSTDAWPDPASSRWGGGSHRPGGSRECRPGGTLNLCASKSTEEDLVSFHTLVSGRQHTDFVKFPCP